MAAQELNSTSLISDANLKSYFRLENASDTKGLLANLTANGTVAYSSAKFNNGLATDHTTGGYLDIADSPLTYAEMGSAFTLNLWVRFDAASPTGDHAFIWIRSTNGTNIYQSYFGWTDSGAVGWQLTFFPNSVSGTTLVSYANTPTTSAWYMLTGTYDGTNLRLYLNGTLVAGPTALTKGTYALNAKHFYIMGQGNVKDCTQDDTSVFSRALTATEISNLFNGSPTAWTQTLTDSATLSNILIKSPVRLLSESATLTDTLIKIKSAIRLFPETLTIADTLTKSIGRTLTELFGLTTTSVGPNSPGTTVDDATVGTVAWTNPNNAQVSDAVYATSLLTVSQRTHYLKATNFGFSIPAGATINGIVVELQRFANVASSGLDLEVKLIKSNGLLGTTNKADGGTFWPTSEAYKSYASSADLWGETWAYSDINNSNCGVAVSVGAYAGGSTTVSIDHIRITVYYTTGGGGIIDSLTKTIGKQVTESSSFADTLIRSIIKTLTESFSVSDILTSLKAYARTFTESFSLSDILTSLRTYARVFTESFSLSSDSLVKSITHSLAETITIADSLKKAATRLFSETITITDSLFRSINHIMAEAVTIADTLIRTIGRSLNETFSVSDTLQSIRAKFQTLTENFSLADTITRAVNHIFSEAATIADTLQSIRAKFQTLIENFSLADSLTRAVNRIITETAAITDTIIKTAAIILSDVFTATDSLGVVKVLNRILTETVAIADSLLKTAIHILSEIFTVTDQVVRGAVRALAEAFTLSDLFSGVHIFGRIFTEAIVIADSLSRAVSRVLTEILSVIDSLKKYLNSLLVMYSDKYSKRNTTFSDKYSKQNTTFNDKYSTQNTTYTDKYHHPQ